MNEVKSFFRVLPLGTAIKFTYEGEERSGPVNFVADRVVNIFCDKRLSYRSFSYNKIQNVTILS